MVKSAFYFYATGSLIAYMLRDRFATTDDLFAAGATFTLLAWAFAYAFAACDAMLPGSFSAPINPAGPRTWMELLFLSIAVLSSVGLSDILPVTGMARALVMSRVLLLDIAKHANALGADGATIAKEGSCARLDHPLVRHVREDEPLDAHETRAARQGHRQRRLIRSGEHLDAKRHCHRTLHFVTDDGERGDDLRADAALEIWAIVRVLNHHAVEAGRRVDTCVRNRGVDNLIDALTTPRCARKPGGVNDPNQRS